MGIAKKAYAPSLGAKGHDLDFHKNLQNALSVVQKGAKFQKFLAVRYRSPLDQLPSQFYRFSRQFSCKIGRFFKSWAYLSRLPL